ncbi:acyltransferase domain-containing protein, partial [Nocardiopsis synnemataformans]|uniref:acyltransferase domain-containing protein n=1 Tax=Nocardiopsis synnemataformans TaxID=61305 RepID=UPI003EB81C71
PVRFSSAVGSLLESGHSLFVEASAHPVLTIGVQEAVDEAEAASAVVVPSLRRDEGGAGRFLSSLGAAHVGGAAVDWEAVFTGLAGSGRAPRRVDLPTYAFQHQHYWAQPVASTEAPASEAVLVDSALWEALESEDVDVLAATLGVDGRQEFSLSTLLPALSAWRQRHREHSEVLDWRYDVTWKRCPDPGPARLDGTWLVLTSRTVGEKEAVAITDALGRAGASTLPVALTLEQATDPVALAECLKTAVSGAAGASERRGTPAITGIVSLLGLDEEACSEHPVLRLGSAATVNLLKALPEAGVEAPVWAVTRGAVSVSGSERLENPVQALVWGLGRCAALEHPDRWGGLVDLPTHMDNRTLDRLCAVVAGFDGEDQVALRASGVHVRRLVRSTRSDAAPPTWRFRDTVLVTGGSGD